MFVANLKIVLDFASTDRRTTKNLSGEPVG